MAEQRKGHSVPRGGNLREDEHAKDQVKERIK